MEPVSPGSMTSTSGCTPRAILRHELHSPAGARSVRAIDRLRQGDGDETLPYPVGTGKQKALRNRASFNGRGQQAETCRCPLISRNGTMRRL